MTDYTDIWYHSEDGLRLYARDYPGRPGAPVVVCLHGLTRNSADFAQLAAHLAPGFRVLVADQRGRGRSAHDPVPANYQPAVYVADMFRLLDTLDIPAVQIVGTSMGGLMGMMMAAMQPARVSRLVLNDIGPEVNPAGLARIKAYVGKTTPVPDWEQAVTQSRAINGDAFPDFSEQQWLDFTRALYRDEGGSLVLAYDPAIATPIAAEEGAAVPPDLWPLFESLALPVLVLRGALSDILAPECVQAMQSRGQDCHSLEIPRRGHAPTLNEPAARGAIDEFLAGA